MSEQRPKLGQFCWNELMTPDAGEAKVFYQALFGWTAEDMPGPEGTYTMYKNGDQFIGGMMQIPVERQSTIPPNWMTYVLVDDIDSTVEKSAQLGAVILVARKEIPGMGVLAVIEDPTGAVVSVWQSTNNA